MARDLYIAPLDLLVAFNEKFSFWHAVPVGDGTTNHLASVLFTSERSKDEWEEVPGVITVGSELGHVPIDAEHAAMLKGIDVTADMKPKDVRKHIKQRFAHPLF